MNELLHSSGIAKESTGPARASQSLPPPIPLDYRPACLPPYQLPGNPETDVYLIPVSGGADSSYLAILLHQLFPDVMFRMPFTDTNAEDEEIYTCLDRLEAYIGRPIERLSADRGLFEMIDHYKGYLPSGQSRWCTPRLKLDPLEDWMKQFDGRRVFMFIGVRADEADRLAFTTDRCITVMPFIEMGIKREDVFAGMSKTIGIPLFYRRRVRSGCANCFFQRRSEVVGLMQEQPVAFHKGKRYEKVSQSDLERHQPAPNLSVETGVARNWLWLPQPAENASLTGKVGRNSSSDLFGNAGVFVAAEFMFDGGYGYGDFVWAQRVISYSSTLHGIKRQVQDRYAHLLSTSEVHDMTPDDVRRKVKFAIYYIEAPASEFDPRPPVKGSYTWSQGTSYAQIEHIIGWAERVLHAVEMQRQADSIERLPLLSWQYECAAGSVDALNKLKRPTGQLVSSEWFKPDEPKDDFDEEDIRFVRCAGCQV